ncbi:MAG: hypothetical protein H6581_16855 [Bacteroidia bacterium]|nr:hypothetical protein [Bacteroidia bacterium]
MTVTQTLWGQDTRPQSPGGKKGRIYLYWGYNWDAYTKSNLHFKGNNYNFTLQKVIAKDFQYPFSPRIYFSPVRFTIPQYNYRMGYFLHENWDISIGMDHMKYVVQQEQDVSISGFIQNSQTPYDGIYAHDSIRITKGFLKFEHTDGLNYINCELRHTNPIFTSRIFSLNVKEGLGLGILLPKTNTTLLNKARYDQFHLAGLGTAGLVAINFTFFNAFFLQSELKGGFIALPDIRTTQSKSDRASQSFFFTQWNVVAGGMIRLEGKKGMN